MFFTSIVSVDIKTVEVKRDVKPNEVNAGVKMGT